MLGFLAKICTLLEKLMSEKDLRLRLDSQSSKEIGEGIQAAFLQVIRANYNAQGFKDYSSEATRKRRS
ncbi:hypothetical protein [uncultured Helicobacter sp.]|uniref:hypothetical protein n=2 Tax=uncultured Helicobacter sp. TaxID=175537 RepID=UPI0025E90B3F|nr:hypothetical protein [uncultured Helicobacter sp.]